MSESDLKTFTFTYSAVAESKSNPVADDDVVADSQANTDNEFYVNLNGGWATAGDGDGICTSQSVNGQLSINGADSEEVGGLRRVNYPLNQPRRVSLTSSQNNSGVTLTIKGKNGAGVEITETVTGPNNASVYTTNIWTEINMIYSGSVTNALTIGDNAGHIVLDELARLVSVTSDGNSSSITYTVTGLDIYNNVMTEDITGPSSSVTNGTKYFKYVASVKGSASDSNNIKVGAVAGIRIVVNNQNTRLKNWYMVQAANAGKAEITLENGATSSASGTSKLVFNPGQGDGVVNYPSIGDNGIRFKDSMSLDMAVDTDLLTSVTFMYAG
tara:strand:- start:723 stop:1706 length:984 start_codon:yes stop_codon:yes gene_type:complete